MESAFARLSSQIASLNDVLFARIGAAVAFVEPSDKSLDVFFISRCGTAWWEASADLLHPDATPEDTVCVIEADEELLAWLGDASFGCFTKSELYLALLGRIVLPSQIASRPDFSGYAAPGPTEVRGISINLPSLILTGIEHGLDDSGQPAIRSIRGEIPAADEFYVWGDKLDSLKRGVTLEDAIDFVAAELSDLDQGGLRIVREEDKWGSLFDPRTASELLIMHRAVGTLRHGCSLTASSRTQASG